MSFIICRGTLGSLAIFTAIRNASSHVSRFIDICRWGSSFCVNQGAFYVAAPRANVAQIDPGILRDFMRRR